MPARTMSGGTRSWPARRLVAAAIAALALLFPAAAAAKPPTSPPRLDTATASGDNLVTDDFSSYNIDINAFSGPSGEDPGGQVSFEAGVLRLAFSGPVSCLEVTGNTAIMRVEGPFPERPGFLAFIIRLVDNGGSGRDRFEFYPVLPEIEEPLDCQTGAPGYFGGTLIGRAVVTDAPPPPTSKEQCRNGGYATYGFTNQGLCIRSVAAG